MITRTINTEEEPVSLEEAKDQCFVMSSDYDAMLYGLITAARQYAENYTWRTINESTYVLTLEGFPEGEIELPNPPCLSVESIEYVAPDGTTKEFSDYDVAAGYGKVRPTNDWPLTKDAYEAVTITYKAGYEEVPQQIKQAILLMVAHLFNNRESVVISGNQSIDAKEVPLTTHALLDMYSARRPA